MIISNFTQKFKCAFSCKSTPLSYYEGLPTSKLLKIKKKALKMPVVVSIVVAFGYTTITYFFRGKLDNSWLLLLISNSMGIFLIIEENMKKVRKINKVLKEREI